MHKTLEKDEEIKKLTSKLKATSEELANSKAKEHCNSFNYCCKCPNMIHVMCTDRIKEFDQQSTMLRGTHEQYQTKSDKLNKNLEYPTGHELECYQEEGLYRKTLNIVTA
uniref:Uncharacterized protein n=1 Tax=Romanomermis culicivorax TaxID=13658 RepID=A0A915KFI5_ROMCU